MTDQRDWTVLFIGGASGVGKSSVADALGRAYQVNILEVDDVHGAIKAVTTAEALPAIHYFDGGIDWMGLGVERNMQWLIDVSRELAPGLRAIVEDHVQTGVRVIIEGDFIHPEWVASLCGSQVKALFVHEPDVDQIIANYAAREGGAPQRFRAKVSAAFGGWLAERCDELGIPVIPSRPWSTAPDRAAARIACL